MKAIVLTGFGGTEVMDFGDVAVPEISESQILIKNYATSVNAPDIIQRRGNYPPPEGDSEILGLEVAGVVEQVGSSVDQWRVGDKVLALIGGGGYAEYSVANAAHVMPMPKGMTFHQAACVCETYLTAYLNIFMLGGLEDSQQVLLHGGGGGVNTAGIQLCKNLVPNTIIFVTASTGKIDRVKDLGADHVIDYIEQSFADEIALLTDKKGVNVILDHIGGPYFQSNMKSLAIGGRLLQIGVSKGIKSEINLALMMVKRQQIIGSVLRSRQTKEKASIIEKFSHEVLPLMDKGNITPLISNVFPLADAAKAHQVMENSTHFGKIVLEVKAE